MAKKKKKSYVLRFIALCFSIYMIISLGTLWKDLVSSRNQLNAIKTQAEAKSLEIDELMRLLDSGTETEIIENAARERLGYVFADEVVFIDISGK